METLSCHSNQSSHPTKIKNITFVASMPSFSFILYMVSEKKFLNIFTKIDPFCRPDNQSNTPIWTKVT